MPTRSPLILFANASDPRVALPNYDAILALLNGSPTASRLSASSFFQEDRALFSKRGKAISDGFSRAALAKLPELRFARFGATRAADASPLTLGFERDEALETALLSSDALSASFLFVAPARTFELFLDCLLEVDVVKLCATPDFRTSDFYLTRTTELERDVLRKTLWRLGALFADGSRVDESNWRGEWRGDWVEVARDLGDEVFYWETRALELGSARFPLALLFSRDSLFLDSERIDRVSGGSNDERDAETKKGVVEGSVNEFDAAGNRTVELVVEVGSGEISEEEWRALRPGSILTTNASADDLFLARLDGIPAFRVKPGAYRGTTAVQFKERIGGSLVRRGFDAPEAEEKIK